MIKRRTNANCDVRMTACCAVEVGGVQFRTHIDADAQVCSLFDDKQKWQQQNNQTLRVIIFSGEQLFLV
jgi:hypothetical protein